MGEWTYESEAVAEPGGAPLRHAGSESVRRLGGVWVLCEGRGETPGQGPGTTLVTLGCDVAKRRFVGALVGSSMTNVWMYEGELDAAGSALTLASAGPSLTDDGAVGRYRSYLGDDGRWKQFMTMHHRRSA